MADFKDKEEYEQWKARRLNDLQEKRQPPDLPSGPSGPPPQDKKATEVPPAKGDNGTTGELSDMGNLFSRTWGIYKNRVGTLITLYLLTALFFALALGLFVGLGFLLSMLLGGNKAVIAAGAITGALAGIIAMTWGIGSSVFAVVDESLGTRDALVRGWKKIGAFAWFFSLFGFILTGGFLVCFIPGVIFLVWFSFGQFILAAQDEKGMNAIMKSKEYVKGQWFDVFLRLFVIWTISGLIGMVPFIGPLLSLLFAPFMTIFTFLIYRDLKALKGEIAYSPSAGEKFKWIGVATLGYVVLPVIIISLLGAALTIPLMLVLPSLR